jgi:hypothetical protein
MTRKICLVLAAAGAAVTVTACSSSPASITASGKVTVDYTMLVAGGTGDDLSDGSQVVVVNSSGTVIGNGTLAGSGGGGLGGYGMADVFTFKVTVPGGLPRYGIQVGGTSHGTAWESAAQMQTGPALEIDETTGS